MSLSKADYQKIHTLLHSAKKPLLIYDRDTDGFVSYLLLKRFQPHAIGVINKGGSRSVGKQYLDSIEANKPDIIFTLDMATVEQEFIDACSCPVVVIDHHVSAADAVKVATDHLYDNSHSGATLAWVYFHKDKKMPQLLRYIEDRDLWRFSIPDTTTVCASVDLYDYSFKNWDKLARELEEPEMRERHILQGRIVAKYEKKVSEMLVDHNAQLVDFEGYQIYCVNAPHVFASLIGSILCNKKPPIGIIWSENHDGIAVSLRSDGSVDVSKIAEKYGGGGHKSSSGFSIKKDFEFPWKKYNKNN